MSKKLTPWFSAAIKPVRKGIYMVQMHAGDGNQWYSYWDGVRFNWHSRSREGAFCMRSSEGAGHATARWRGLAKKPSTKDAEVSNG